jgi:hypothetical protein
MQSNNPSHCGACEVNLKPLEAHLLAHFLTHGAKDVQFAGRWFPRHEFIAIFGDRMGIAARAFGPQVVAAKVGVAEPLVDYLLESEALITKTDKFGGVMHQFQNDVYRQVVSALTAADPILTQARDESFWETTFAELTN